MVQQGAQVLVVDDDLATCRLVEWLLVKHGYSVKTLTDPQKVMEQVRRRTPDLALLDVRMPRVDGLTVMRQLRREYEHMPIVMLTASAQVHDRVAGLESGADDYIVKPFDPTELVVRVRAVLRRARRTQATLEASNLIVAKGGLRLDMRYLTASTSDGEVVRFTPVEARILYKLMTVPNRPVSPEELRACTVGKPSGGTNEVAVHIHNIRRKLGDRKHRCIATVPGGKYTFCLPPAG